MSFELGRYQILETIGEGAMAKVIKAYDPTINRLLAIKILKPEFAQKESYRARFLQEANAAGTLSHPGIVTIYDVGETEKGPYIAMELLPETTLEQLQRSSPINDRKTFIELALQIAAALNYAHQKGIIHRDLKPANIMFTDNEHCKITDFGIAHNRNIDGLEDDKDKIMGTPEYISPEQLKAKEADQRSDLFSLGVVFYQLLSGELPFAGDDIKNYFKNIVSGNLRPLKPRYDVPATLISLIEKLLANDPNVRLQSSAELFEALKSIYQEIVVEERIIAQKKITPIRFKWTAVMGLFVALTMAIASTVVYFQQYLSMRSMVFDYGSSLSQMLATESAESLLIEDLASIRSMVEDISHNKEIAYIEVLDHNNKSISHSLSDVNKIDWIQQNLTEITARGNTTIYSNDENEQGVLIYTFSQPVLYREKQVGTIKVGLGNAPLNQAANTTILLMLGFMFVTLLTVFCVAYYLSYQLSKPIAALQRGFQKLLKGNFDNHIPIARKDEFGQLFEQYNQLAQKLKKAAKRRNS